MSCLLAIIIKYYYTFLIAVLLLISSIYFFAYFCFRTIFTPFLMSRDTVSLDTVDKITLATPPQPQWETPNPGVGSTYMDQPVNLTNELCEIKCYKTQSYKSERQRSLSNLDQSPLCKTIFLAQLGRAAELVFRCSTIKWHPPPTPDVRYLSPWRVPAVKRRCSDRARAVFPNDS